MVFNVSDVFFLFLNHFLMLLIQLFNSSFIFCLSLREALQMAYSIFQYRLFQIDVLQLFFLLECLGFLFVLLLFGEFQELLIVLFDHTFILIFDFHQHFFLHFQIGFYLICLPQLRSINKYINLLVQMDFLLQAVARLHSSVRFCLHFLQLLPKPEEVLLDDGGVTIVGKMYALFICLSSSARFWSGVGSLFLEFFFAI